MAGMLMLIDIYVQNEKND